MFLRGIVQITGPSSPAFPLWKWMAVMSLEKSSQSKLTKTFVPLSVSKVKYSIRAVRGVLIGVTRALHD